MKELSGQRFGRLVVLGRTEERKYGNVIWLCECDCGAIKKINGASLRSGRTYSCGCIRKELAAKRCMMFKTHGHCIGKPSRTYRSWQAMIQRCINKKLKNYIRYGGRGIKVCERWLKFAGFLEDMGERPEATSIERKDNNGNYEPENCEWASAIVQTHNSCHTKLTTLKVQVIKKLLRESKLIQKDIAEIFYVSVSTVNDIKRGRRWINVK